MVLKIYHLYRDFFRFLRATRIEKNLWHSFKEYYYNKYKDFLSNVWFKYQGYTLSLIKERVLSIKKGDYSDLEASLKTFDIDSSTRQIINDCRQLLYIPEICNIYLYIGFFSPDAFVLKFNNRFVIAVGLERFHNFKSYPLLLAHEYCHFVQNVLNGESPGDLLHRLVREGMAILFSEKVYGHYMPWEYLFMDRRSLNLLNEKLEQYIKEIAGRNFIINEDIFHGVSERFYPRAGYYIGYMIVKKLVNESREELDFTKLIKSEVAMVERIKEILK